MDRLPAVAVLALAAVVLLAGCGGGEAPPRSRVEGVKVAATPDVARFCDASWAPGAGPLLALPLIESARPGVPAPVLSRGRWVWVNLWATWCVPCRREMPLLGDFVTRLRADGVAVDLWFVSIDESADDLHRFLAANPAVAPAPSVRVLSQAGFRSWMAGLTSAEASAIPINLIAAPDGRLRCLRSGSLRDGDFPVIRTVLGQ
jgi:thiol-disulfide isomerase/thioredoxin